MSGHLLVEAKYGDIIISEIDSEGDINIEVVTAGFGVYVNREQALEIIEFLKEQIEK
jgi:hypothetical protein